MEELSRERWRSEEAEHGEVAATLNSLLCLATIFILPGPNT